MRVLRNTNHAQFVVNLPNHAQFAESSAEFLPLSFERGERQGEGIRFGGISRN
jgi:hypothetical protein